MVSRFTVVALLIAASGIAACGDEREPAAPAPAGRAAERTTPPVPCDEATRLQLEAKVRRALKQVP